MSKTVKYTKQFIQFLYPSFGKEGSWKYYIKVVKQSRTTFQEIINTHKWVALAIIPFLAIIGDLDLKNIIKLLAMIGVQSAIGYRYKYYVTTIFAMKNTEKDKQLSLFFLSINLLNFLYLMIICSGIYNEADDFKIAKIIGLLFAYLAISFNLIFKSYRFTIMQCFVGMVMIIPFFSSHPEFLKDSILGMVLALILIYSMKLVDETSRECFGRSLKIKSQRKLLKFLRETFPKVI